MAEESNLSPDEILLQQQVADIMAKRGSLDKAVARYRDTLASADPGIRRNEPQAWNGIIAELDRSTDHFSTNGNVFLRVAEKLEPAGMPDSRRDFLEGKTSDWLHKCGPLTIAVALADHLHASGDTPWNTFLWQTYFNSITDLAGSKDISKAAALAVDKLCEMAGEKLSPAQAQWKNSLASLTLANLSTLSGTEPKAALEMTEKWLSNIDGKDPAYKSLLDMAQNGRKQLGIEALDPDKLRAERLSEKQFENSRQTAGKPDEAPAARPTPPIN